MVDQHESSEDTRISEDFDSTCVGETLRPNSLVRRGKVLTDFTLTNQDTLGSATALNAHRESISITPIDNQDRSDASAGANSQVSMGASPEIKSESMDSAGIENREFELGEE
ncbi:MAG: hypothetical protein P1V97_35790, partial [Planctomycetota bacterium]|nr:hypothetical protein [Planctomycetota bacterium]